MVAKVCTVRETFLSRKDHFHLGVLFFFISFIQRTKLVKQNGRVSEDYGMNLLIDFANLSMVDLINWAREVRLMAVCQGVWLLYCRKHW